ERRLLWVDEGYVDAPVLQREGLRRGEQITGPAVIESYDSTTYVAPRWSLLADDNLLVLQRGAPA
ncbi:MAG: hypothetical protein JO104_10665, partial [Candidatus Eremiobacteraeota bacterium]|nr:hypothetical protein [Candidatus Eremiobacteraeota bacterium]